MAKRSVNSRTKRTVTGIVARERLFASLDRYRDCAITWIVGPPGAGKTVLVSGYLESRRLPRVWHQFEPSDTDPAAFFQHLGEVLSVRRPALPRFSDEYRSDLAGFCRRFWLQYFARMHEGVVVLDGLQSPMETGFFGVVLHEAIGQLPARTRMIVISRDEPPKELAGPGMPEDVKVMGWEELRFNLAEVRSVAASVPELRDEDLQIMHEQAGGWIAGLRMLLEHYRRTGTLHHDVSIGRQEALFGFLATEVFDRLSVSTRNALLSTCMLPRITQQSAHALSSDASAWAAIVQLNDRALFVEIVPGADHEFRYHAMFKDFLWLRARDEMGVARLRSLQQKTAAHLAARGEAAHAIPLYSAAGDWVAAARLILVEASQLLARGHTQTLRGWVQALPSWYVDATPRLLYCLGLTQSVLDPVQAHRTLERTFSRFMAEGNKLGQTLTMAAAIQTTYFQYDAFHGLDRWIEPLRVLLDSGHVFPTPETELHVCSMLQIAMTYRQPGHPYLETCADRVLGLISRGLDVNQTVAAAGLLLSHYDWFGPEKARLVVGVVQPLLAAKELTPFNRLWWLLSEGNHYHIEGNFERASTIFSQVRRIACPDGALPNNVLMCMLDLIDESEKGQSLARFEAMIGGFNRSRRQEEQNFINCAVPLALRRGDRIRALDYAEHALRLARETGHRTCELEALGWQATALVENDRPDAALESVRAAREIVRGLTAPKIEFHHLLIEANAYLKLGRPAAAHGSLRKGFEIARARGYSFGFQHVAQVLGHLCAEALEHGIESQHVQRSIQILGLLPPSAGCDEWPWRVRIRVLGRVEIRIEESLLAFDSKAQRKPLELLRALVVRGAHDVSQAMLAQELWPDSEADVAESALRNALHRLRKLLRTNDSVVIQEGKLRLNDKICWVDAWALEELSDALDTMPEEHLARQSGRLLGLYAGPAFEGENVQPWILPARERWRGKFLRAVGLIGSAMETRRDWDRTLTTYQRGLEAEPLSEDLYCRVMNCHLERGDVAQAYSTYRRCRDILSITLGIKPSARTEALRRRISELGAFQ